MIVVLTDPRRPEHLPATLASLDGSGADRNRIVVVDGEDLPRGLPVGWKTVRAPKPRGVSPRENRWSTWRAFELAAEAGEDLLFFEDDVLGSPNAVRYAELLKVPTDCAWVMLYAPWGDASFPYGIGRFHADRFSFCQALKIPLQTCRLLAAARGEMEVSRSGGSDECMRQIGARRDWLFGVHWPGLFQHVGVESVVSNQSLRGDRTSRAWFAGMDAMSLLPGPRGGNIYR